MPLSISRRPRFEALTHRTDGKPQSKIVIDHENYFIEYVTRVINTNAGSP